MYIFSAETMVSNFKDPSFEMSKIPEGGKLAILLLNLRRLLLRVGRRLRRGGEVTHNGGHGGGHGGRGVGQLEVRLPVERHNGRGGAWRGHVGRGGSGVGE